MNPTNTNNLPSRLKESSFRRYENTIQHAITEFPEVIIYKENDLGISCSTFASRLRDAMASLVMYRWTSEVINMDKFDELYSKIKVSHVIPNIVVIGSLESIKQFYKNENLPPSQFECLTRTSVVDANSQTTPVASIAGNSEAVVVSLSQDTHDQGVELKFLAGLAASRLLNSAVEIQITAEIAKSLEDNYDVVLTSIGENKYTIQ